MTLTEFRRADVVWRSPAADLRMGCPFLGDGYDSMMSIMPMMSTHYLTT